MNWKIRLWKLNIKLWSIETALSKFFLLLLFIIIIPSCKVYRFTDASVDPNWKTFSINQTINVSTLQNPNAAPNFTEKLKDKFSRETRLALNRDNSDLEFSATITEYNIDPVSISITETTAQNRLNISVKIDCINNADKTKSYTLTFRDGENFDANRQFVDLETGLVNSIYDRLVQQIFNRTFGNW